MSELNTRNVRQQEVRVSAFDVLVHRSGRFLAVFYTCWVALTWLLSYARIVTAKDPPLAWPEVAIIVIVAAAVCAAISIPLAFAFSEGIPMVIAKLWLDRAREEGRAEGREEGREEIQRAWEAWNERRLAAERADQPFTEPPPSQNGVAKNDAS